MTGPLMERAARALAAAENGADEWDALDEELRDTIRENVRTMFVAMLDPTEAMLEAVHVSDAWANDDPEGMWRVMIDAALRERETER